MQFKEIAPWLGEVIGASLEALGAEYFDLFFGDPERGAITRDAPLLRLLYGVCLFEVSRRLCLTRAA